MSIRNPVKADIDVRNAFEDVIQEFDKLKRELAELRESIPEPQPVAEPAASVDAVVRTGDTMSGDLALVSSVTSKPVLSLTNTNADDLPPYTEFRKNSASPAASDYLGIIDFYGNDSGGTATAMTRIMSQCADPTDTSEDGRFYFVTRVGGTLTNTMILDSAVTLAVPLVTPSYVSITGAADASGNLRFSAANPYIVASSYITMPGGLYVSGGTLYCTNEIQARGGVDNDSATYLSIGGGTGGGTHASSTASAPLSYTPGVYVIAKPVAIEWRSNNARGAVTGYDLGYAVTWTTATNTYENESTFALVTRGGLANAAIQVKKAGAYLVTCQLEYTIPATSQGHAYLLRLDSSGNRIQYTLMWSYYNAAATAKAYTANMSGLVFLDANDELLTNVLDNTSGDSNWARICITRLN